MQETLVVFLKEHYLIAPLVFILLRSTSIIIPPIPGLIFDLVGIAVFGPVLGFIYAETGSMLGAMIAFLIARHLRQPVVKRLISLQKLEKWEKTVSEHKKFWTLVAMRLPTNAFFDYISYAAGLTRIKASTFFFSSLLGNLPIMILFYAFGGVAVRLGWYYVAAFVILVLVWILFFGRFFAKRFFSKSRPK